MTDYAQFQANLRRLVNAGALHDDRLIDPIERDACGVGFVAAIDGAPRRDVVEAALHALRGVKHRGAVDADGKTGDGAGLRLDACQGFFHAQVIKGGDEVRAAKVFIGQVFLPRTDLAGQEAARAIVESEIIRFGFRIYSWRQVPVDPSVIGAKANATRPEIEQVLFYDPQNRAGAEIERVLFLARRRIENRALAQNLTELYICSLSAETVVYKGLFLADQIDAFYPDLRDPSFVSKIALFHQRYSTNTFPQWRLAQPFRLLAHNGEINTLKGNVNWMRSHEIKMASQAFAAHQTDVKPIIQPFGSDSAALDNVYELLVRAGRSAPMAKALLVPESWQKAVEMPQNQRDLYHFCASVMEPWDGPAALVIHDGDWAVAGLDRNGLRPLRYELTEDGLIGVGSEAGLYGFTDERIAKRGQIAAGRMIGVNFAEQRFYDDHALIDQLARKAPYGAWLERVRNLEAEIGPGPEPAFHDGEALDRRLIAASVSHEDLETILRPLAETGKEAIGSMGDDAPLAVLSEGHRPLFHFFRQGFAQVTNPPIDPLREDRVMSLKTRFKNLGNILAQGEMSDEVLVLDSPVLTNGMMRRIEPILGDRLVRLTACFSAPDDLDQAGEALRAALERLRTEAEAAVRAKGHCELAISDRLSGPDRVAIPSALAIGAVHSHLVRRGLRSSCSLIVEAGDCLDAHAFAVLVGIGATAVNAYLAQDAFTAAQARGAFAVASPEQAALNFKRGIEAGLLKILSKLGISVIASYRGGCNFEALGLSRALVDDYFPGMNARISGIGLQGLAQAAIAQHRAAWESDRPRLAIGGFYRQRQRGAPHAWEAKVIHLLQKAVTEGDRAAFDAYTKALSDQKPIQIRDLLDFAPRAAPIPLSEVENVNALRRRFVTPGMSLGSLSPEAHGALNVAMNRIGAKSISGEGGEDRARYRPLANGDDMNSAVKQVASGRFGVTAEYLNQCREIEIKIAQGAKPGEGGQLPGFKVTDLIASLRHATPGVTLISPPPHHDIYSIEDLAQLIHDLKQISPRAEIAVKLVAQAGVGAVAAGVAKAQADVIAISGHVGGTGASPQSSIKFAGSPWELGLSEAHQVLTLNNLRHRVRLRTDGGLRTARDIVIAAILGAEEFGIGTASLLAMGCLMVRQCHSNTCPVGVCTQDEKLRARFTGSAEKVIALMTYLAEDVRALLAKLGARSLEAIIGRTDLLRQVSRGGAHLDDLDLNSVLVRVESDLPACRASPQRLEPPPGLDERILSDCEAFLARGARTELHYAVSNHHRSIGARISAHILSAFGPEGAPADRLTVHLEGTAGQSLGAFAVRGLRLDLVGEANDYVGKGLSGAHVIVRPRPARLAGAEDDAILGNTCLYGATSGALYAAGRTGERFAVRNSGARAVVHGCGANGCEYMTGGAVAILGAIGENFGAGMTGGEAFLLGEIGDLARLLNPETVEIHPVGETAAARLKALLDGHATATAAPRVKALLAEWPQSIARFAHVTAKEAAAKAALAGKAA